MTQSPESSNIELRVVSTLAELTAVEWDALSAPGLDGPASSAHPFLSWTFLHGLEQTGCVAARRGWWPCHLTVWRAGRLIGAAPAYVKNDGMGDFSRDWAFAEAMHRLGSSPYPKMVIGVPFTPATGPRLLHHPSEDPKVVTAALIALAQEACRQNELTSIQVLYHSAAEQALLSDLGLAPRALVQYHWINRDFETVDDWLARLKSKRRTQARRERREPGRQGISLRTLRRDEIREHPGRWARTAHALYQTTCDKYMWGGAYLTRDFFRLLFEEFDEHVELVIAQRADEGELAADDDPVIAGAINIRSPTHLYGRYWGCFEEHRFLHFNVCLYHSIEQCIEHGTQVFEGGAGGEHKVARGFEPHLVHGSLWFADERLQALLGDALRRDAIGRQRQVDAWREDLGIEQLDYDEISW